MATPSRREFVRLGMSSAAGLIATGTLRQENAIGNQAQEKEPEEFNILDFGAVGDGTTINTAAIQQTIDTCTQKGGGRVVVPRGKFLTGGITLKSKVNLHLEQNAEILGSPYIKDYEERHLISEARYQKYLRRALVFAQGENNVTVSGAGTLNGNGQLGGELGEFANKGGSEGKRPCLLWFDECKNILVRDITYKNSAMWTETYSRCSNIHVDSIRVTDNYFFNADGCNIVDCEDFIIENCDINTMDDGICLKGYTHKGCVRGIIRNNKVRSICNGIKMGTDSSGGFRDIVIEDNEVWQTGISGLALEIADGGAMENITVRNIKMNVVATPIFIMMSNRHRKVSNSITVPMGRIRNVVITNIDAVVDKYETYNELERKHFNFIPYASSITGFPGAFIEDIRIEKINMTIKGGFPEGTAEDALREIPEAGSNYPENRMFGTLPAYGFFIRHARGLRMKDICISIERRDGRPAFLLEDVHDSGFDTITVKSITPSPAFSVGNTCSGIQLDL